MPVWYNRFFVTPHFFLQDYSRMFSKEAAFGLLYIPAGLVFIVGFVAALFMFCVLPA